MATAVADFPIGAKLACLRFLDSGDPTELAAIGTAAPYLLIRWLDESGVALYFHRQCHASGAFDRLPSSLTFALARRETCNRVRVNAMLDELRAIVGTLHWLKTPFAVLKGFSLAPEFCPDIYLRHHTDIDLLLRASDYPVVIAALNELGYFELERQDFDEVLLATASSHVATAGDFLYTAERQKRVELHTTYNKDAAAADLPLRDWAADLRIRRISDFKIPVLSCEEMFVGQLLHAFRHLLGGWVRPSWLWEIAFFVRQRGPDTAFWKSISERLHNPGSAASAGTVLLLIDNIFPQIALGSLLPEIINSVPVEAREWIEQDGIAFILHDFPGTPCPVKNCFGRNRTPRRLGKALLRRLGRIDQYLWHSPNHPITLRRDMERLVAGVSWRLRRILHAREQPVLPEQRRSARS